MKRSILLLFLLLEITVFAQINLDVDRAGIGVDIPESNLHVFSTDLETDVLIENNNAATLILRAGSPTLRWQDAAGEGKASINWQSAQLKFYSSPPVTGPPPLNLSFTYPTLNMSEERKVGINMGLAGAPSEALDVNGRIKVGNSPDTTATAGTIRWNDLIQDFEGFDGDEWLSLTAGSQPPVNPGGVGRISDVQHLVNPNHSIYTSFGFDVAISGDRAVAGAIHSFGGLEFITCYEQSGTEWQEVQSITPADVDSFDSFGYSVAMEGDWLFATAPGQSSNRGAVYVYLHNGSQWVQNQKITLSGGAVNDRFGRALELKGNTLMVGCDGCAATGAVIQYTLVAGTWVEGFTYYPPNGQSGEQFGYAVALNDDHMIVGSPYRDTTAIERGVAYIYDRNAALYVNPQVVAMGSHSGGQSSPYFGQAVATSGDYSVVTRRTGGREISLWQEDANSDHNYRTELPYRGLFDPFDPEDRQFRDVDMEGMYLIAGLAGYDGGSDCNNVKEGIGKVIIMKRQGDVWLKCDEFLDPSGVPNQGNYMSVAITPDGEFIIGIPGSGYGSKVVFGRISD